MLLYAACAGDYELNTSDGPLPMAIFELLEYIVNEVRWRLHTLTVSHDTWCM